VLAGREHDVGVALSADRAVAQLGIGEHQLRLLDRQAPAAHRPPREKGDDARLETA